MAPKLDVVTDAYDRAATVVIGDALPDAHGPALRLVATLGGCAGMAGSDPPAREWAHAYDAAPAQAVSAARTLFDATYRVGVLLEHTGRNHAHADAASTAGRTAVLPPLAHDAGWRATLGRPPHAGGAGSTDAPTGWGLVEDLVGYVWPNGHQDTLRTAATAWRESADGLDAAAGMLPAAAAVVATVTSPEIDDALEVIATLRGRYLDLARAHHQLGRACTELAEQIDRAHSEAGHELAELVAFTAGTEAVGAVLSVVTFGAAQVPTQAAVAARIAVVAGRLRALFVGIVAAVRTLGAGLRITADAADAVTLAMQGILRLRPVVAGMEDVRALPMLSRARNVATTAKGARTAGTTASRARVLSKAESKVWQKLKPFRGKTKTNGARGSNKRYYEWDHTHGDIEVYDHNGRHLGTMHGSTTRMIKPADPHRRIHVG